MNIVTPFPSININTANVHTESARRDNQLREVIPPTVATKPSNTENKALSDGDKTKSPGSDAGTYDAKGRAADNKAIEQRQQGNEQSESEQSKQEQQHAKQTQKAAEQDQQDAELIDELKARDSEVRMHEQAHAAVGDQYAGTPSYEYQHGPDGTNYAVGGEVQINVAEIKDDPQATIEKMQVVRAAALAPQAPSSADRAIAADATQKLAAAQAQLTSLDNEEQSEQGSLLIKTDRQLGADENALETSSIAEKSRENAIELRAKRIASFYQSTSLPVPQSQFTAFV